MSARLTAPAAHAPVCDRKATHKTQYKPTHDGLQRNGAEGILIRNDADPTMSTELSQETEGMEPRVEAKPTRSHRGDGTWQAAVGAGSFLSLHTDGRVQHHTANRRPTTRLTNLKFLDRAQPKPSHAWAEPWAVAIPRQAALFVLSGPIVNQQETPLRCI